MKGETLTVVQEEERPTVLCALMDRAEPELVTDTVFGTHEFRSFLVGELIGFFGG